jgi:hypothetical protein
MRINKIERVADSLLYEITDSSGNHFTGQLEYEEVEGLSSYSKLHLTFAIPMRATRTKDPEAGTEMTFKEALILL